MACFFPETAIGGNRMVPKTKLTGYWVALLKLDACLSNHIGKLYLDEILKLPSFLSGVYGFVLFKNELRP
ncbi:MAG: hypothetical protein LBB21_04525 [Holosporaceae bacterium]|jgi:hypothetical protein|nr:hypothetical protein [Holosporaceae bacterium]